MRRRPRYFVPPAISYPAVPPGQAELPPVPPPAVRAAVDPELRSADWICQQAPFSFRRAYIAATLSNYAYHDAPAMPANLAGALGFDFAVLRQVQGPGTPAFYFVHARCANHHVIAIRGTENPEQWLWYTSLLAFVDAGAPLGKHIFFIDAVAQMIWDYIETKIPAWDYLAFVGHSLGGMAAARLGELAAIHERPLDDVWSFGAPMGVDTAHRHYWREQPLWDVVNELDLIAQLPGAVALGPWRADMALASIVPDVPVCVRQGRRIVLNAERMVYRGSVRTVPDSDWWFSPAIELQTAIRAHYAARYLGAIWSALTAAEKDSLQAVVSLNRVVDGG